MIRIKVDKQTASIDAGIWRSRDMRFATLCDALGERPDPVSYEPNPDLAAAERVVRALGGAVLNPPKPEPVIEGRVY
jgi:hypothetical protein